VAPARAPATLLALTLALAAVAGGAGPARAQAPARDAVVGEAAFRDGRRLLKAGQVAAACERFGDSMRADPAPGTLANLADCEERLGRVASAWRHWQQAAAQMAAADPRRAPALARAHRLEPRVPRLTVRREAGAPQGTAVECDGEPLDGTAPAAPLALDPGTHRLRVTAPGREPRGYEVKLAAGERRELTVGAGAAVNRTTPPPLAMAAPLASAVVGTPAAPRGGAAGDSGAGVAAALADGAQARPRWRPVAGYALAGVSAAALAGGIYFGLRALDARKDARAACTGGGSAPTCWSTAARAMNRDLRDSRVADVAFVTSAATGVAAAYLLLVPWPAARSGRVQAAAAAGPGGAEVRLAGAF
jgi:hypothetical protein